MTIKFDILTDSLEKIDDASNLIVLQETELTRVHNAVVEHHAARKNDNDSDAAGLLDAAANFNGECAASLNRAVTKVLGELRRNVNELIASSVDDQEANHDK